MATTRGQTVAIATTNEVIESAVIRAPLAHVWHLIQLRNFQQFWSAIKTAEHVKGTGVEEDVVKWTFKDGSAVEVKQDEHSVIPPILLRGCEAMLTRLRTSTTSSHTASSTASPA